jgi:hypothetical protein
LPRNTQKGTNSFLVLQQKLNAGLPRDWAHPGLVFGEFAEKVDKPKFLRIAQRFGLMEKWKRFAEFYGISSWPRRRTKGHKEIFHRRSAEDAEVKWSRIR